ncbi:UNVERIFIED_CONTAM: hypothetical protein FKN15_043881 [Acipenser sinensis]
MSTLAEDFNRAKKQYAHKISKSSPVNSDCTLPELEMKLDITGLRDDYYLNLLDWNSKNLVAVALNSSTYMWNAETHKTLGAIHLNSDSKYVSSVAWINHGNCLAIGTSDGEVQKSICGLKWSPNGRCLASGSSDGLLNIWPNDPGVTVRSQPLQTMAHPTAVKAMDWCPWQCELVAVGGGMKDGVLRIWDTNTGSCIKSTHTNSQVSSRHQLKKKHIGLRI